MLKGLQRLAARLGRNSSGNVTLMMAMGMPALIGGAGLAVDTAQWYMWQKELQYSADQAAIAGAWAKAYGATGTIYKTRAQQELTANQEVVNFINANDIDIHLANYDGGTDNSVVVQVSATKILPFTGFVVGKAATVSAYSQASFAAGNVFSSCLIAVNPTDSGSITLGGNATVNAKCGIAALSNSPTSIVVNGEPTLDPGWVVSAGGIDDWFNDADNFENGIAQPTVNEYITGLTDPFAGLTPPDNTTPRTYACAGGTTTYTAYITTRVVVEEKKYKGTKSNKVDTLVSTTTVSDSGNVSGEEPATKNTATGTPNGYPSIQTNKGTVTSTTSGSTKTFYRTDRVTTTYKTINSVGENTSPYMAAMLPGTYADFTVKCNTTMASGVYVIDGGMFAINSTDTLSGSGVMIVLKNGAGFRINGTSAISLTPMTAAQLTSLGLSEEQANKLANILVFEQSSSSGNFAQGINENIMNGTTDTVLNGKIYLPRSPIRINGTATITSQCLLIAANTITIEGNANYSTFCAQEQTDVVATTVAAVKLVS
jgi:Flp pilus assembly protein TadG